MFNQYKADMSRADCLPLSPEDARELWATGRTDKLIESVLPLVVSIAAEQEADGDHFEDLVQAGNLGVCVAAQSWDPDKGAWSSWAYKYARAYIANEIESHPLHCAEVSLDWEVEDADGFTVPLHETIASEATYARDPAILAEEAEQLLRLRNTIADLPERQAEILDRVIFGEETQEQIAADLGISQQAVQKSYAKGLLKLKSDLIV